MKGIQIITDGSCIGNPGPGGCACILQCGDQEREMFGSEAQTTNNRMELTAAINGLKALPERCEVELVTDSQYLKQGITQFMARWKANGWRTSDRRSVLNQDMRRQLWMSWRLATSSVGLGYWVTGITNCKTVATHLLWMLLDGRRVIRFQLLPALRALFIERKGRGAAYSGEQPDFDCG